MMYNWQQPDWPKFKYSLSEIEDALFDFAEQIGHISGMLNIMPEDTQMEAIINTMVAEAIKTSRLKASISAGRILFLLFVIILVLMKL